MDDSPGGPRWTRPPRLSYRPHLGIGLLVGLLWGLGVLAYNDPYLPALGTGILTGICAGLWTFAWLTLVERLPYPGTGRVPVGFDGIRIAIGAAIGTYLIYQIILWLPITRPPMLSVFSLTVTLLILSLLHTRSVHEQAAGAKQREQSLRRALIGNLLTMAETAEGDTHRDGKGHGRRVASLAAKMARHLGWNASDIELLRYAALLHELGDQVEQVPGWSKIATFIRHLPEHVDGTGTPDGLSGREIPAGARILAVADAFDDLALVVRQQPDHHFPTAAIAHLEHRAGTVYDRGMVRALVKVLKSGAHTAETAGPAVAVNEAWGTSPRR